MVLHVADNPPSDVKEELSRALYRIRQGLSVGHDDPTTVATALTPLIESLDQARGPLLALQQQQAIGLLDEARLVSTGLIKGKLQSLDRLVLWQAIEQLADYLESYLVSDHQQGSVGLSVTTNTLRLARQHSALQVETVEKPGTSQTPQSDGATSARPAILDTLKQLHHKVTVTLEGTTDQSSVWAPLQGELQSVSRLLAGQDWTHAALLTERLEQIAGVLATGDASYGPLAASVLADALSVLGQYLQPSGMDRPSSAIVLADVEERLAQLETLLKLPGQALSATAPTLTDRYTDSVPHAPSAADGVAPAPTPEPSIQVEGLDLDFIEWPVLDAEITSAHSPATRTPAPSSDTLAFGDRAASGNSVSSNESGSGLASLMDEVESPRIPATDPDVAVTDTLSLDTASAAPGTSSVDSLVALMGIPDADPEFVEVFLEEACAALETIREQLVHWRNNLADREALTTIRRAFHTLKGSGRMVGATVIGDFAWEFESLLNEILSGNLAPSQPICDVVKAAVNVLAPLVGETPLQGNELSLLPPLVARAKALAHTQPTEPATTPLAPVSEEEGLIALAPELPAVVDAPAPVATPASADSEIDPEFLEVFLEEARGQLDDIRAQLVIWERDLGDRQVIGNMRRAFHTLKGSGRVVGATLIGDFAWEFENLLNQMLSGTVPAAPAIVQLIGDAANALEPLVNNAPLTEEIRAGLVEPVARMHALIEEGLASTDDAILLEPLAETSTTTRPVETAPPVAPVQAEPLPDASSTPVLEPVAADDSDADLAQVFHYEAAEILDASDLILQQLATADDHSKLLNDLRRNMHTLKGSSRMSGFMTIGDLAHAAESVMDAISKGDGQASPVVLDSLQHTLDQLNRMMAAVANDTSPAAAVDLMRDLHRLADSIVAGEAIVELPPSVAAPEAPVTAPDAVATTTPEPVAPFRQTMTELDQELVQVFQTEAGEILDSSDTILQRLRTDPANVELLNDLRREMHTLKGSSRMAGFMTVGDLAHAAESLLDALGKGTLTGSASLLDYIQRAMDRLHQMLAGVLKGVQPPSQQALIDELHAVLGTKPPAERSRRIVPTVTATVPTAAPAAAERGAERPAVAAVDTIRVSAGLLNTLVNQMGESSIFRARIDQGVGAMNFSLNELEQTIIRLRRQITHLATQAESRIQSRQDEGVKAHQQEFDPLELDRFTELQQVSRSLMEIADDLGNIGNTLGEHTREVTGLLDQQGKVNKEIQQRLMRTGMVRFGTIIPRLRRVVRQSSQELGKRAELLVGGEDAEVDRNVLENMIAPLEHMMRNSLAHGIEDPERRRLAGKPEIGTISLSLRREGAELVMELGDDGSGLNFDAIRTKGLEKGLLSPDQPASHDELIALLLRPGFSTASAVTQISGRGVGMDVVNEAIRAMRGALLIQTDVGQGTRFIIRLPFSLSVTQALLARVGESIFAIPLLSIELVTRLKESEFQSYLSGDHVLHRYAGREYPIHNLGLLVGVDHVQPFEDSLDRRPPTLLFRSAEASAALQVEAVLGNREIIVKPVGPQFAGVPGISGATILGDGRVIVVLELAALVRNVGSQLQKQSESRALRMARQEIRQDKINIMVIDDSITMRKVTARILERHNIQVVTAKDGLDAVAMLQTQVPDLAILDIEMPRMDGFEVVAHVRNQPHLREMPIIMVTSRGGDKHRDRAVKLGVNDYLTKPYQEEQLMQSIRRILGERALTLIT